MKQKIYYAACEDKMLPVYQYSMEGIDEDKIRLVCRGDGYQVNKFWMRMFEEGSKYGIMFDAILTNDGEALQFIDAVNNDIFLLDVKTNKFIELKKIYPNIRQVNNIWKMILNGTFDLDGQYCFEGPDYYKINTGKDE